MAFEIDRKHYSDLFGPTTGDSIRLADTGFILKNRKRLILFTEMNVNSVVVNL